MTIHEATIAKIQQMSEPQVREVQDFIDFLMTRGDRAKWEAWQQFTEGAQLPEAGMSDYLARLEDYEERLARGEVRW
ncbi:MAG: hypothetical protein JO250_18020 [Armatimonadetes bacterium]|nr:hypothetical protein [Armatimonadota bacterium]